MTIGGNINHGKIENKILSNFMQDLPPNFAERKLLPKNIPDA